MDIPPIGFLWSYLIIILLGCFFAFLIALERGIYSGGEYGILDIFISSLPLVAAAGWILHLMTATESLTASHRGIRVQCQYLVGSRTVSITADELEELEIIKSGIVARSDSTSFTFE